MTVQRLPDRVIHTGTVIHSVGRRVGVGVALSVPSHTVRVMSNWINIVSRDHVEQGVRGRFTQANHGKPHMLRRMAKGDWVAFYSPRTALGGEPLQAFTAIGRIADDEPYQVEVGPDFAPWRRNVDFIAGDEAPIRPLIEDLHFIEDKKRWGYRFRFGVFRLDDHDLGLIRQAMGG